jgi:ribonuclease HI
MTMSQGEGVFNRRMVFCETMLSTYNADELYIICDDCDRFFCICCPDFSNDTPCHHYPLVFTDGACSRNGQGDAMSGIGGSFGDDVDYQWSIPVDGRVDSTPVRTNQRAELLAAIEGVRRLGDFLQSKWLLGEPPTRSSRASMVVATDSEYVCKGVTEWMPKWKVCLVFSQRSVLFLTSPTRKMDGGQAQEKLHRIRISFAPSTKPFLRWNVVTLMSDSGGLTARYMLRDSYNASFVHRHFPRQFNRRADLLAKAACPPAPMLL